MERLALAIAELDEARRAGTSLVDETKLTPAEHAFCVLADCKGKRVLRGGWPDFLVYDPESESAIAVEVKTSTDSVRPSQVKMFTMLEAFGMIVMIWNPANPTRLINWRKHKAPGVGHARGPRPSTVRVLSRGRRGEG